MPPSTTVSTSSRLTTAAAATPRAVPASSTATRAAGSPAPASAGQPRHRVGAGVGQPGDMRSSASWLAYASRQPRAPHRHRGTVRPDRDVAELAAEPPGAPEEPPVEHDAGADADLAGDVEEAGPLRGRVGAELAERGQVRLVLHGHRRRRAPAGPPRSGPSQQIDRTGTSCQSRLGASRTTPSATRPGTATVAPATAQPVAAGRGDRRARRGRRGRPAPGRRPAAQVGRRRCGGGAPTPVRSTTQAAR